MILAVVLVYTAIAVAFSLIVSLRASRSFRGF